ncbi:MAG: putative bifunctional diguanylate cyclase/phosphodiesterase [Candidatus Dormibacteria bacterium]
MPARGLDANGRLRMVAVALFGAACLLWGLVLVRTSPYSSVHILPVWGLAVLFFITERTPAAISPRVTSSVGLSAAPLVLGLFFSPPWAIIAGYLVGAVVAAASRRDLSQGLTAFTIAQFAFFAALATLTFQAIAGTSSTGELNWNAYVGVYAATLVLVPTSLTTAFALAFQQRRVSRRLAWANAAIALAGVTIAASYGILTADLLWTNDKGLFVAVALGMVLLGGYGALLAERRERRVAQFLRATDDALHHAGELEPAIVALISRAREMFEAEIAQLTIYPTSAATKALRTTVYADDRGAAEVMAPIDLTELDDILEADSDGMIIDRSTASEVSRHVLARRSIDHAMVALLRGQSRMVGSLLVGNPVGARTFDQHDLHLFQTLAIQSASTLEHGRLEQPIARLTELQEQVTHQAFHDSLTDLANRALFTDRIDHALQRRSRTGKTIAVLFIDLDDFKAVNDTLGHAAGDELLIGVAGRLRSALRRPDTAARLGGDEFSVLIEDISLSSEAEMVADRIFSVLQEPFAIAGQEVLVHASIGVAMSEGHDDNAMRLMQQADVAMYAAKAAGKRRRVLFVPGMEETIVSRHRLRIDLERALLRDEFDVHYQPIVDLRSGRMVGTEALARWRHRTRGMIGPEEFIPAAEETGAILALGEQVLRKACTAALGWQTRHPQLPPVWVSVNVSARQLQQPLFVEEVLDVVHATGLPPSSLALELTESVMLGDAASTIAKLDQLRRAGIRIAIDDFGTGYSSLSYLRRLPIDILKVAKPFVDDLDATRSNGEFARAIIGIGSALHLSVIAEGIENVEQMHALLDLDCGLGQGFHLSHPVAAAAIDALLDSAERGGHDLGVAPNPTIVRLHAAG